VVLLCLVLINSCARAELTKRWKLPKRLSEVSALTVGADGRIFTLKDEKAIVYELDAENGDIRTLFKVHDPALRGDFEGLALINDDFFLVTSSGIVHKVAGALGHDRAVVSSEVIDLGLSDICEVEGLSAYLGDLYIACKVTYREADQAHLLVFKFNPENERLAVFFRIPISSLGVKKMHPSGIAVTADVVYVISARQRRLTMLRHNGDLIGHHKLSKKDHRQPEGIAVRGRKIMIADEGDGKRGRITIYPSFNDMY